MYTSIPEFYGMLASTFSGRPQLVLAREFGWLWMDPLAGVIGATVIANWSYGLMRDTGAILLDMSPDQRMTEGVRHAIEDTGDQVLDLHIWRVGPGHMSAVVSIASGETRRDSRFYHAVLRRFKGLSHVTIEVNAQEPIVRPGQSANVAASGLVRPARRSR